MVRTPDTAWSGSTAENAFLTGATNAAGAEAVLVTIVIDGQPAWLYGRRNDAFSCLSSPRCLTSPNTPTTVSQGLSEPGEPILMRLPRASSPGQSSRAMV